MTEAFPELWRKLQQLHAGGVGSVLVTVAAVRGSTPADAGAKMLVTEGGAQWGTVGGGKIEARAICHALGLLAGEGGERCGMECWNLQRDVGMTCGGEMTLLFEVMKADAGWRIFIFGAGHVSQAVVRVLASLDCRITVFDVRQEWLDRLPEAGNLLKRKVDAFEDGVTEVTAGGFVLSITKGHATDLPVLREILRREDRLPFVGVIGSLAKRAVLVRELQECGISREAIDAVICPVGLDIGGNGPEEIAISIVAQLLQKRDLC